MMYQRKGALIIKLYNFYYSVKIIRYFICGDRGFIDCISCSAFYFTMLRIIQGLKVLLIRRIDFSETMYIPTYHTICSMKFGGTTLMI